MAFRFFLYLLLITISPPDHLPLVFPSSLLNLILPAFFSSFIFFKTFLPSVVFAKALLLTICIAVGGFSAPPEAPAAPVSATAALGAEGGAGTPASPMMTVKQPRMITPPWAVGSPMRAAISPPIKTVGEPITMMSGGPTQVSISVTRAAGRKPMRTVGSQGGRMGPPTCGTSTVTIGQTCMSVARAAGGILSLLRDSALPEK